MKEFKVIKALLPLLRRYPWAIPVVVVMGTAASLAEGLGIGLFIPFLQSFGQQTQATQSSGGFAYYLSELFSSVPTDRRVYVICACIFASILLRAFLSFSNRSLHQWLDARIGYRLRSAVFDQLLAVNVRFLERSQSGRLTNILTTETERTSLALQYFFGLLVAGCELIVLSGLLLFLAWKLALVVALVLLSISVIAGIMTRWQRRLGASVTKVRGDLTHRAFQCMAGMKIVRAFGQEKHEREAFDRTSGQLCRDGMKSEIVSESVVPLYEVLVGALLMAILIGAGQRLESLPAVLVFLFMLFRLQPRVIDFDRNRVRLAALGASVDAVTSLISRVGKSYVQSGTIPFEGLKEAIRFDHMSYQYNPEDELALEDISISIPAGKTTALVGASGGGKSTLINLILRFYDPVKGHVYVDGIPLPELDLASWRSRIAMVSQDVFVFNTTVRENIAYGRPDATDDEIVAAARQSEAHEFISRLPDAYDTVIGEMGVRLSGGQNQRLTLARAILRNPDILILDEATNALDSVSENLIQDALDKLSEDRTVIVVAHRLSTIERADHIIVLEDGRVCEQGERSKLIDSEGLFARLHNLQYRGAVS